jgi:hypothetical protein
MRLAPCDRTGGAVVSVSILGILILLALVAVGVAVVVGLVMFFTNRRKEGEL